jgi:hypothetical protein
MMRDYLTFFRHGSQKGQEQFFSPSCVRAKAREKKDGFFEQEGAEKAEALISFSLFPLLPPVQNSGS